MRPRAASLAFSIALVSPTFAHAQGAPTSGPTPLPASAPTPAPAPGPLPVLNAAPAEPPEPAPAPSGPPGYYVEPQGAQAPRPGEPTPNAGPPTYEPPIPAPPNGPYEPPPPPVPRHVAPRTALWLGARVGWFFPFGSAYAAGVPDPSGVVYLGSVPWTNFVASGPAFELDAGVRLARNYNLFGLWERAELRSGSATKSLYGGQNGGDTDYFAVGLRASSDADGIGVLTELSLGYRQARASWEDGSELRMTGGILEGRIGIGADIRLSPLFSLQPIIAVGVGSFDRIQRVLPGGGSYDVIGPYDAPGSHGWVSLSMGGSVDLFGAK